MVEDLREIYMKEFQKCKISIECVLGSYLFNQYVPDSKIFKGFLIRNNKFNCLHMWIENGIEVYDIGNMYNFRVFIITTKKPSACNRRTYSFRKN